MAAHPATDTLPRWWERVSFRFAPRAANQDCLPVLVRPEDYPVFHKTGSFSTRLIFVAPLSVRSEAGDNRQDARRRLGRGNCAIEIPLPHSALLQCRAT